MDRRFPLRALGFAGFFAARVILAQHEGHEGHGTPAAETEEPAAAVLFGSDMTAMTGMRPSDAMGSMAMPGWHVSDVGIARLVLNRQGGRSGGGSVDVESSNWNMLHAQHDLAGGRLTLMMMNSLEPATFAAKGSRELFQTGEAYRGQPLVDRQHPHDFFMNLSATWRRSVGPDAAFWIQAAPVGEPALGPVAFMHRASAGENPTAPIGHHWEDSTHIAFHVVTAGAGWRFVALDASVFRGQEPDEHRWDIEGGRIDSAAVRARFFFGSEWSAQVSHGFLKHPEPLEKGNTHRTTASLSFAADGGGPFSATILWGRNDEAHGTSDGYLAEAAWQATARDQIFGRAELVQKDEALLRSKGLEAGGSAAGKLARIGEVTLGYVREVDLGISRAVSTGAGGDVVFYSFPSSLRAAYGSTPVSVQAFFRVRWGAPHGHHDHAGM